jgi:hypothetical protein
MYRLQRNGEVDTKLEIDLDTSEMEETTVPPPQVRENRPELFSLLYALCSDLKVQGGTQEFFNDLTEKKLWTLTTEGHIIIRRIINYSDDQTTSALHEWVQQLLDQTWDRVGPVSDVGSITGIMTSDQSFPTGVISVLSVLIIIRARAPVCYNARNSLTSAR